DGLLDAVTANADSNTIGVLLNDGAGGFLAGTAVAAGGSRPHSVAHGDINGDSLHDVVTANQDGTVGVLLNNGAGGFGPATAAAAGGFWPVSVVLGNIDSAALTAEDTALVFSGANGNAITVSDVDGTGNETVTLSAAHGTLALATLAGVAG